MSTTTRPAWARPIATALGIALLASVLVLAFLWPAVTSEAKDLPVVVAGQGAERAAPAIDEAADGLLDVTVADDRAAAVDAIQQRDALGAVVLGDQPEVLVASAASPAVAQMLRASGTQIAAQGAPDPTTAQVTVTDVVPLASSDPNGSGLAAAGFPMLLGGMIGGIALSFLVKGASRRLLALGVYAVVGGLLLSGILGGWFGILQSGYLVTAAACALSLAAVAAPILGAVSLVGRAGIAVGPIVFMLFANPISSAATPTQFLPAAWGQIGQWFPPGASANLVRTLSYFPDASTLQSWLVLAAWAVAGVAAIVLAPRPTPTFDLVEEEPEPEIESVLATV